LRYFNAAGATSRNGEQHDPTPDGTCVRDYVHVSDLARAHVLALHALDTLSANALNLGSGGGSSVAQVIDTARRVTGRTIRVERGKRRPGDPGVLVASSEEARHVASWEPMRQDLALVIEDAWKWSLAHPDGYGSATHSCGAKAQ
jgi:UDP-glucose 4-epimerase